MKTKPLKAAALAILIAFLASANILMFGASPAAAAADFTKADKNCFKTDTPLGTTTPATPEDMEGLTAEERGRYGAAIVYKETDGVPDQSSAVILERSKAPVICALHNLVGNALFASISLMIGSVLLVLVFWKMIFRGGGGRMGGGGGGSKIMMLALAIMFLMPTQVGLPALSAIMNFGYSVIPRVADLLPT